MAFNSQKFQMLRFGNNDDLKENTRILDPGGKEIIPSECVKDLGIMVDNKLNFKDQRNKAISKTRAKAAWVLHTFRSRSRDLMVQLWKSLIQPHLDYCGQLWAPVGMIGMIKAQEGILKAYTKKISGCYNQNYWERLKTLKMLSSERRAERYKIMYIWKIINGLVPNLGLTWLSNNRRSGCVVVIPRLKEGSEQHKTMMEATIKREGARLYNSLPKILRTLSCTKDRFKRLLDMFLEDVPDNPNGKDYVSPCMDRKCKPSNSIKDWAKTNNMSNWRPPTNHLTMSEIEQLEEEDQKNRSKLV